jgi:hypothetical protein
MPMPRHSAEARRALQMLADSPTGCTASVMLARGFMPKLITGLIKAKLATAELKSMKAGAKLIVVRQIRITDAGRVAAGTIKLTPRRAQGHRPGNWGPDDYDVLDGTREIGRIYLDTNGSWFWGVSWMLTKQKSYGTAESRDEAMAALRAAYERWLKEPAN